MKSLENNSSKGKSLFIFKGIELKELKYKSFRFYFIKEENKITVFSDDNIDSVILTFLDMSKKDDQQKIIDSLKLFIKNKL